MFWEKNGPLGNAKTRRKTKTRPKNRPLDLTGLKFRRCQHFALKDNEVKAVTDQYIQYLTDTDYGTSGSPVFNDYFHVVALHNQRVQDPSSPGRWYRNQGYRIGVILAEIGGAIG
jgi:V8-like Glu-specific endopeptidase